jgi:cytochrome c peroxidase
MRGFRGDEDSNGRPNEIADVDSEDFTGMWAALTERLTSNEEYRQLLAAAYPDLAPEQIEFVHAANAIGAFEVAAFTFAESPFNRFLLGDDAALDEAAMRGAGLFFGKATCATCHTGPLLSDQQTHAIAAPQVGPGKSEEAPEDHGRGRETFAESDTYAFRTPPLHNVAITGPWMHDGAFTSLEAVIRHHIDPAASLLSYDPTQTVGPAIYFLDPDQFIQRLVDAIDPTLAVPELSDAEIADLVAFLGALTDPAASELEHLIPARVPSGLPVDR